MIQEKVLLPCVIRVSRHFQWIMLLVILPAIYEGSAYQNRAATFVKFAVFGALIAYIHYMVTRYTKRWHQCPNSECKGTWRAGIIATPIIPTALIGYYQLRRLPISVLYIPSLPESRLT